jgi:hypothetical protein
LKTAAGISVDRENLCLSADGVHVWFYSRIEEQNEDVAGERRATR